MYKESTIQDCLFGLVGYRQNQNPDYPQLTATVTATSTGLVIQDEHPLLSIENIDQALKNYDAYNYPAYNVLTAYVVGDQVRATNAKVYECIDDSTGDEPSASPLFWKEVPLLSQKLEAVHRSAINKVVNECFLQKKLNEVTKTLMENIQLFDGAGSMQDKEIKLGRFVGYQIIVENNRDILTLIKRIGFQFSQVNPDFTLYVYHSSQEDPIYEVDIVLTKANSFEWKKPLEEISLAYLAESYAPGGAFYIGYYEDDLVGQAVNRGYNFGEAPQNCCGGKQYHLYSSWSKFIRVTPFAVAASKIDTVDRKLWDYTANEYTPQKSYGLNLDLSVKCDVSNFLCREKEIFTQAILKQCCVDLLKEMAFTGRNNTVAKEVQTMAFNELYNKDLAANSAQKKLSDAIKALTFDLSGLNEACLPEDNFQNRINYTTI